MHRRAFLKALGLGSTLAAPFVATRAVSDGPVWSGWRQVPNMMVDVGFWTLRNVSPAADGRDILVSTAMGHVDRYAETDAINCTRMKGWPLIGPHSTDREREVAKQRALDALYEAFRG